MAKHLVVVIDWYGPFKRDEALRRAKAGEFKDGLYLATGKRKHQRGGSVPQYIGLSSKLQSRLAQHKTLPKITRDQQLWLGEVGSANVPGPKVKKTTPTLDLAEWAIAYFVRLPLNNKKTINPPRQPVSVLSRWWKPDYENPWIRKRPSCPDFIDYLGEEDCVRMVWFHTKRGIKQKLINPPFEQRTL